MKNFFSALFAGIVIALGVVGFADGGPESIAVKIGVFGQEVRSTYTTADGLPSNDVLSLAVTPSGDLYAGTAKGLAKFSDGHWVPVTALRDMTIERLATGYKSDADGLLILSGGTLYFLGSIGGKKGVERLGGLKEVRSITALAAEGNVAWIGTNAGLFTLKGGVFASVEKLDALLGDDKTICAVARGADSRLAVGARSGLFVQTANGEWVPQYPNEGERSWSPKDVRAVGFDTQDRLWFASLQGAGCLEGDEWKLYTGKEGLPYNDFTSLAFGEDGAVWFGTHIGAIRFDGSDWAYREGKRWLPDNDIRDIVVTRDSRTWFATSEGVGLIEYRPMTFAEKAEFYENEIDKRHRRTPFEYVYAVGLKRPGDKSEWIQRDDDNDGQYTGMYGAAECFAYAATKDPKAKERATKAFEALRFFSQVTQGGSRPAPRGFPARTILPTSGWNPNESVYTLDDDRRRQKGDSLWKVMHPRWPTSADGEWYWKCDTSSDELDGHYYLYGRYYDLVAETEAEKERVREVVRNVTDHLIEHNFRLVDWDGKPTRWANFSPDSLNRDSNWWPERGLNSLSILGYLRVAEHVTGDAKYTEAVDKLIREHGYAMNCMVPKIQRGPGSFVQFDDEMAFLNYYNVIQYEKDPKLREMFVYSCFQYWELVESELCPFYNFSYAACCQGREFTSPWGTTKFSPSKTIVEESVDTLKRYPLDLVSWKHTNSHRKDIVPLPAYVRDAGEAEGKGYRTNGKVLPVDERFMNHWADDFWALDTGDDGNSLATGYPFLLAYYMGLYHGFIVEE
ncbi:MAG: hypothetical protein ABIH23_08580 [bacterium]